jgi:hypothetical protein
MPIRKGNHSKRRHMYFRGDSKRDIAISQEEEQKRYDAVICQYCKECMEKFDLIKGKIPRRIGICGICGNDGFITGSLFNKDEAIVFANMYRDFEALEKG